MIDPIQSLAFSMHSGPGVYALLLGSGVSRSAQIPTGWEIVMDLLGKLAAAAGENPEADLEQWYRDKYGDEPKYSSLIEKLAKTQAERQQLLRPYFEPSEQEREQGIKQPTDAHRAIARLVFQGFVKVIITTNFDRLIEKALDEEGVEFTTLNTLEQVRGAIPLIHTKCCVFKVHGDYQDTRIRNSEAELSSYPAEFDQLLDRIFDEFGLLVCGWSAEWDSALRDAIFRAPSRRFTAFWALRGDAGDEAQQIIDQRGAQVVPIEDADSFFQAVQEAVASIEEFSRPHPLSTEAAVASLKRFLSDQEHRIRLLDLIDSTIDRAVGSTAGEGLDVTRMPSPNKELVTGYLRGCESAYSNFLAMAPIGGFWAEDEHLQVWERAFERLSATSRTGGHSVWLALRSYPAVLLLYSFGLGAVDSGRLGFLNRIFGLKVTDSVSPTNTRSLLHEILVFGGPLSIPWREMDLLEGMKRKKLPFHEWVYNALRDPVRHFTSDDVKYEILFDRFEILMSLAFARSSIHEQHYLPGRFIYRETSRKRVLAEIRESIANDGSKSRFIKCGILGNEPADSIQLLDGLDAYAHQLDFRFY